MIEMKQLSKTYAKGKVQAVKNLSLEVKKGADGGGDELRFLASDVLRRVEVIGDLFASLLGPVAKAAPRRGRAGGPAAPGPKPKRP